ncbi:restriction endonuclease subunit S [Deinococcus enclensis]
MNSKDRETKRVPAPRLRFPRFEGGWEEKSMRNLFSFLGNNSLSREKLNYISGKVKNIHYGDVHTTFSSHFDISLEQVPFINPDEDISRIKLENFVREGDLILADASEDTNDIGKAIEIISLKNQKVVSGLHTILARPNENTFSSGFLGHLFKSDYIRKQIQMESQGAKVLGLSVTRLAGINLFLPTLPEQTYIAAALSTLDATITAHQDKLKALQQHKQGLMQGLFPAEGEKMPRLRFPEFKECGDWQGKKMGEVLTEVVRPIKMADDQVYSLVTVKRRYGGVIKREDSYGKNILVKTQFLIEADDFLISKRQIVHSACGVVPKSLSGSIVSNEYSVLRTNEGYSIRFFQYFSQQPVLSRSFILSSNGIVIEKMLFNLKDWLNREFLFPTLPEQIRIAACLSSLDDLMTAQAEKIAALQEFKRGLMQGLFPRGGEG